MADDWQPGDLALCVADLLNSGRPLEASKAEMLSVPAKTGVYTVIDVSVFNRSHWADKDPVFLKLSGYIAWYNAEFFRKINPLTEDEEREARREIEQDKRVTAPARVPFVLPSPHRFIIR